MRACERRCEQRRRQDMISAGALWEGTRLNSDMAGEMAWEVEGEEEEEEEERRERTSRCSGLRKARD